MLSGNAADDGYVTCDTFLFRLNEGNVWHSAIDGRRHRRARLAAVPLVMALLRSRSCLLQRDFVHSHHRHFWLWSEIHVLYERVA